MGGGRGSASRVGMALKLPFLFFMRLFSSALRIS